METYKLLLIESWTKPFMNKSATSYKKNLIYLNYNILNNRFYIKTNYIQQTIIFLIGNKLKF